MVSSIYPSNHMVHSMRQRTLSYQEFWMHSRAKMCACRQSNQRICLSIPSASNLFERYSTASNNSSISFSYPCFVASTVIYRSNDETFTNKISVPRDIVRLTSVTTDPTTAVCKEHNAFWTFKSQLFKIWKEISSFFLSAYSLLSTRSQVFFLGSSASLPKTLFMISGIFISTNMIKKTAKLKTAMIRENIQDYF